MNYLSFEETDAGDIEISAVGHLHLCSQVDMMDVCQGKPDGCYDFEESIKETGPAGKPVRLTVMPRSKLITNTAFDLTLGKRKNVPQK